MKKILSILTLFICFLASAQNDVLFNRATAAYNEGNYEKAVENYLEILDNGQHSAELYFNLGNSYYKLNRIAPSIYYYEKALLLKPDDAEIKNNLVYAQNMTLDAIEQMPQTGLSKIYKNIIGFLSFEQWAKTGVVFMVLFVLLYIAFYYFRYSSRKRIAFIASIFSFFLAIVSVVFAFIQYNDFKADRPAIVFGEVVDVKSEPNGRSSKAFTLHEGAKVLVLDELNDWKKIQLADGKTGWIPSKDIKLLKDF